MLEAKNIHKLYHDGKKTLAVLKGINLNIARQEFLAVVGPSGAGKSTLLHILGGLDAPSQGRVILQEQDIYALSDNELSALRNQKIGFVFQFYHLLPEFRVLENVIMPAMLGVGPSADLSALKEDALRLLSQLGLEKRISHFPAQLSGGEKQRVAVARGLMNKPQLLFCDEPTGNLDSENGEKILHLLKQLNEERQITIILVTHDKDIASIADRVIHLKDGLLVN